MTLTLERPAVQVPRPPDGGVVARRAMVRWAWRLFRREWRQQLLILSLVMVAVAATVLGATVATNAVAPAGLGFGTAQDAATFTGGGTTVASQIAALQHRFGRVEVIVNQSVTVPGSIETFDIRAQDPQRSLRPPHAPAAVGALPHRGGPGGAHAATGGGPGSASRR